MADLDLLIFGCVVFFVAMAGIYVAARENFVYSRLKGRRQDRPPEGANPVEAGARRDI